MIKGILLLTDVIDTVRPLGAEIKLDGAWAPDLTVELTRL